VSLRTILILVLALVSGISAAAGVSALRQPVAASEGPETVSIVVTTADIPRFTTISADMVTTHPYPKDLVPSGALTSVEEVLDRVVYSPLLKDEPVLNGRLAAKGLGRGMAAGIPNGMQAYTIPTATVSSGMAGFILPGNKVDVLLTVSSSGGKDDPTGGGSTTPLLQSVEILAVDQRVDAPAENKINPNELRSVTLLVTPRQAAMLALGQSKGILHLSLRNPNDRKPIRGGVVTMDDIRFLEGKPVDPTPNKAAVVEAPPPPPPPPPLQIRTLRGSQESVIYIPATPNAPQRR
jgi:pilus assembly protein CpaB